MPKHLFRLSQLKKLVNIIIASLLAVLRSYQRNKLVNINVNIITAGLMAILVAKWPVMWVSAEITERLGEAHPVLVDVLKVVAAAVLDGIADVLIYYMLHWIANHWRPMKPRHEDDLADDHRKFFKNATLVQFERMALTPVYYGVAGGLMYFLMSEHDLKEHWAFVWGFMTGILVTRIVHTLYLVAFAPSHVKKRFVAQATELMDRPDVEPDDKATRNRAE